MPSASRVRPAGVVVLSALAMFIAIFMLFLAYQMAHGEDLGITSRELLGALASRAPYLALLAILPAALSIGLFLMANWARRLTLGFFGVALIRLFIAWWVLLVYYEKPDGRWPSFKIPTFIFNFLTVETLICGLVVFYLLRPK